MFQPSNRPLIKEPQSAEDKLNELEKRFYAFLREQYDPSMFTVRTQSITLAIGHKQTYRPDFSVCSHGTNALMLFETKGNHRFYRTGLNKLKTAAHCYPEFGFYFVQWKEKQWDIKHIPSS